MSQLSFRSGSAALLLLAEAATRADLEKKPLHIYTGNSKNGNYLKFKVGEGMWSPPHYTN